MLYLNDESKIKQKGCTKLSKSFMERLAQQFGISTPSTEEFQAEIVSMVEEGCQQGIIREDETDMILPDSRHRML